MFQLRELPEPIVQAPMAGGPATVELAVAVCEAGGLGFLAGGYHAPDAVREQIATVRGATPKPFGVNLFLPTAPASDGATVARYVRELQGEATDDGVELGEPRYSDDDWEAKLEVVVQERPAVVSFAFGCPSAVTVERLHEADIAVWVTVTNPEEAERGCSVSADALVVQGHEAGGHRGGFDDDQDAGGWGLLALLRCIAQAVSAPLVATGGVCDGAALAAVLCAGASAAQVGTALMMSPEAGTDPAHRALLGTRAPTQLTRAFSGRQARGIVNRFMIRHGASAPAAYPEVHYLTSPLRAAARRRGDADAFNLWAGQAHALAQDRPAGEIVREMSADARRIVSSLSERWESNPSK